MSKPLKAIQGKHLGDLQLLPAKPGTCEWCATSHKPEMPHNAQSLFYQYRFYNEKGRWPTWIDAMEHCSLEMCEHWTRELLSRGIDLNKAGS